MDNSETLADTVQDNGKWNTLAILAYAVTLMVGLSVLTPYFYVIPEKNATLITQGQTTLYAGWMLILAFYYKARVNNPIDANTINQQAKTIREAQSTIATATGTPIPGTQTVEVPVGGQVNVQATDNAPTT